MVIPSSLHAALDYLESDHYLILAGGTDVMVKKRNWAGLPPLLGDKVLNIFHLEELSYVFKDQKGIHIGSTTRLEYLLNHELINQPLKMAIEHMASPAIRHVATLGGNIGNASPAGDTLPILYVFNAIIVLESKKGIREVPIQDFILGPSQTSRRPQELIKEIILEDLDFTGFYYEKVGGRQSDAISKVSFIGLYVKGASRNYPNDTPKFQDIRCAFGAVYKTVLRDKNLEAQLLYMVNENKGDYIKMCEEVLKPIDDQRSTAVYRKRCSVNLLKSFVQGMGGV